MIDLNKLIELPFTPKEVKDSVFANFMEDHVIRCGNSISKLDSYEISLTKLELENYKKLLNEISKNTKKRKSNTLQIKKNTILLKDFVRKFGNLLMFLENDKSNHLKFAFPNGLGEISTLYNGNFKAMTHRVDELIFETENLELPNGLKTDFKSLYKKFNTSLKEQELFHEKIPVLVKEKNESKLKLIKYFKKNICKAYVDNFENPKVVGLLFDNSIISKR